jgi:hypothetical protein
MDADLQAMGAIDIKRCPHCVRRLAALTLDQVDGFDAPGPAVICHRCDSSEPAGEAPLFVPHDWDV